MVLFSILSVIFLCWYSILLRQCGEFYFYFFALRKNDFYFENVNFIYIIVAFSSMSHQWVVYGESSILTKVVKINT